MESYGPARTDERPHVLCVDDDPQVLAALAEVLVAAGYTCQCCGDPGSALAALKGHAADLVIADINLGDASGLEMCEEIRRTPGLVDIPVVFLSGAEIPNVVRRSHEAGGTYYLRKPFDADVVLDLVDRALWMPHLVSGRVGV